MLSHADNDVLCRVGPGTPTGELMRRYWVPALPSSEFPQPDSPPKRMRLLGENLVLFRNAEGRMAALAEACPHRGASLYFGRNDGCGLRCAYHGWKFDPNGALVDLPTEQSGSRVQAHLMRTVAARAYPCRDVNHLIWVYLGPGEPPPFPRFETNTLPPTHVTRPNVMMEEANWLQNMEGDLDSAHLDWLHRRVSRDAEPPPVGSAGFWSPDTDPARIEAIATDYGAFYSARRQLGEKAAWHRITQFIFPFHTMFPSEGFAILRSFVPVDDDHSMLITQLADPEQPVDPRVSQGFADAYEEAGGYLPRTNDPRSYFMTVANKRNDYHRDLEVQADRMFCGIPFVLNLQDRAMTELMCDAEGRPRYDRSAEHLGSTDQMIVLVRNQLLKAARRLAETGEPPVNVDAVDRDRVRGPALLLDSDADWVAASESARNADSGDRVRAEVPLILD